LKEFHNWAQIASVQSLINLIARLVGINADQGGSKPGPYLGLRLVGRMLDLKGCNEMAGGVSEKRVKYEIA
jgi:hypothetical protein